MTLPAHNIPIYDDVFGARGLLVGSFITEVMAVIGAFSFTGNGSTLVFVVEVFEVSVSVTLCTAMLSPAVVCSSEPTGPTYPP